MTKGEKIKRQGVVGAQIKRQNFDVCGPVLQFASILSWPIQSFAVAAASARGSICLPLRPSIPYSLQIHRLSSSQQSRVTHPKKVIKPF